MKKIIAMFVLMLFVISTVIAAPQGMAVQNVQKVQQISTKNYIQRRMELQERVGELTPEQAKVLKHLDRERMQECLESDTPKDCLNQYKIKQYTEKAEMFRERTVQDYQNMRSNFERLKNKYGQIKEDVGQYRDAFKNAVKEGNEEAAIDAAKDYLIEVGDLVINNLERVKDQVGLSNDLTQEEVDEIVADLDAKIQEIQDAQANVEAAETKEEVKQAGQEIVDAWKRMKHKVRTHAAMVIKASVKDVYKRAKFLEGKLERGLENLADKGYDTSVADSLMEDYTEKLESAKESFEAAEEKFKEAREATGDGEAVSALVEEAREYLHAANQDMKDANRIAREILKTVRELGAPVEELTAESEEDYIEVVEAE